MARKLILLTAMLITTVGVMFSDTSAEAGWRHCNGCGHRYHGHVRYYGGYGYYGGGYYGASYYIGPYYGYGSGFYGGGYYTAPNGAYTGPLVGSGYYYTNPVRAAYTPVVYYY